MAFPKSIKSKNDIVFTKCKIKDTKCSSDCHHFKFS